MGLDMHALITKENISAIDFPKPGDLELLHTWRKHHDLHGWMEALYRAKGGKAESFNLVPVRLDPSDLDALEKAVNEDGAVLPVTSGFFFGDNPPDKQSRADDNAFIAAARNAIAAGYKVIYTSWW